MILGSQQTPETDTQPKVVKNASSKQKEETLLPDVKNSLAEAMAQLSEKEKLRAKILERKTTTLVLLNDYVKPYHEELRARSQEVFGFIHYTHLLHVGISQIRGMTKDERLYLLKNTGYKSTPAAPKEILRISRACWLDWQRLSLQIREELWLQEDNSSFGMQELIIMVTKITREMDDTTLRTQFTRISTRKH